MALAEEYLADHFPAFPVLPGVFMLEALSQAGAWLIRMTEDYAHSVVELAEARGVKYADFVRPGSQLQVSVQWIKVDGSNVHFKGRGEVDGNTSVSGRFVMRRRNLADHEPSQQRIDRQIVEKLRLMQSILVSSQAMAVET